MESKQISYPDIAFVLSHGLSRSHIHTGTFVLSTNSIAFLSRSQSILPLLGSIFSSVDIDVIARNSSNNRRVVLLGVTNTSSTRTMSNIRQRCKHELNLPTNACIRTLFTCRRTRNNEINRFVFVSTVETHVSPVHLLRQVAAETTV
jgi:hypothetical protein